MPGDQVSRWPYAIVFSAGRRRRCARRRGAGKAIDGQKLLAVFGLLMVVVGMMMLRPRKRAGDPASALAVGGDAPHLLPRLAVLGRRCRAYCRASSASAAAS